MSFVVAGTSPELMPSIMGAFDAIIGNQSTKNKDLDGEIKTSTPKRSHQVSNFANLSPCVQKILSNVPEQEISKKFSSEETLGPRKFGNKQVYRSMRSPEKNLNKSNEHLEIISTNVQKMLSNLPDTELVISASNLNISRNSSYLYSSNRNEFVKNAINTDGAKCSNGVKQFLYHSDSNSKDDGVVNSEIDKCEDDINEEEEEDCNSSYDQKPLGSYLHSSHGIASRTPVGRKNMGKYLQVSGKYFSCFTFEVIQGSIFGDFNVASLFLLGRQNHLIN